MILPSKLITTTITEDKRLAAAIIALDLETSIAPRGAYRITPTGAIEQSRTFEGLCYCARTCVSDVYDMQLILFIRFPVMAA